MAKEKKIYDITVDYHYGPIDTFRVEATSVAEARKKAKAKYARMYFRRSELKTYIEK